jgi:acyl dehydratase
MARTSLSVGEIRNNIGREIVSDWNTLTFENIRAFADATGDHQWIHVDRERIARESPYGAPIAHGYYTLSRVSDLLLSNLEVTGAKATINYGLNKVRFPAPLKEGASYRLKTSIASVTDVKGGLECIFPSAIEIQGEPKPAMVAEVVFRYVV